MGTVETIFAAIGLATTIGGLAIGAYKLSVRGATVKNGNALRRK